MRRLSRTSIKAELLSDPGDLRRIPGVEDIGFEGSTLHAGREREFARVRSGHSGGPVRSLVGQPPTLEDLFLRHCGTDPDSGAGRTGRCTHEYARPGPGDPIGRGRPARIIEIHLGHCGCCGCICAATEWSPAVDPAAVGPAGHGLCGQRSKVYPTDADRTGMVASIMASPAQRAMYGNVCNDTLGAVGVWKARMFHVLIAVAVILTVIRHTCADEEAGRTELLDSTGSAATPI